MIDHFSYSSLNIPCDLALKKRLLRVQKEGIDTDETQAGREVHDTFYRQDWKALKELNYPDPVNWKSYLDKRDIKQEIKGNYMVGGYKIEYRIDVLIEEGDKVTIIDIKNQQSYTTEPHKHQLQVYALPSLREFKKVTTRIYLPRYDTFLDVERLDFSDTDKIEDWILRRIHHAEKVLKEKDPKSEPSGYCMFCHYILSCPTLKDSKIPTTEEEAKELAKQLLFLIAHQKAIKQILKKWTNKNKNIIIKNKEIGYHIPQTLDIDEAGLLAWCKENKISPLEMFKVVKDDFKKYCKSYPELANLGQYTEEKPEFGVRNHKEE